MLQKTSDKLCFVGMVVLLIGMAVVMLVTSEKRDEKRNDLYDSCMKQYQKQNALPLQDSLIECMN